MTDVTSHRIHVKNQLCQDSFQFGAVGLSAHNLYSSVGSLHRLAPFVDSRATTQQGRMQKKTSREESGDASDVASQPRA